MRLIPPHSEIKDFSARAQRSLYQHACARLDSASVMRPEVTGPGALALAGNLKAGVTMVPGGELPVEEEDEEASAVGEVTFRASCLRACRY